jgi:hypothetical protein
VPQLMTQAEFARHRGVSKGNVTNWKKAGLLVLQEDEAGRLKVNVDRTDARLNAKIDPMRGRPSTGGQAQLPDAPAGEAPALPLEAPAPAAPGTPDGGLADERAQHLREQRIGQAMKNAQMAGGLVPMIEAQRRCAEVGRAARERMHAWMRSVGERFAAEKDVRQIMAIGEEGIDQVFNEMADAAARGDFAGDEDDLTADERAELETGETESDQ